MKSLAEIMPFLYRATQEMQFQNSDRYPIELAIQSIYEALVQTVLDTMTSKIYQAQSTDSLVVGTGLYSYPSTCLSKKIYRVGHIDSSSDEYPLWYKDVAYLDQENNNWRNEDNGTPRNWLHDSDQNQLRIYPPPDTAVTDGLVMYHLKIPPAIERYWGTPVTDTLYASVTNASATVTLSSAAAAATFASGDYFGVIPASGTTGIEARGAKRYYKATTVSDTGVTLSEAYAGATNATAYFVTGQNIELLERYPNLGMVVVFGACEIMAELAGDDEAIAKFAQLRQRRLMKFMGEQNLMPMTGRTQRISRG